MSNGQADVDTDSGDFDTDTDDFDTDTDTETVLTKTEEMEEKMDKMNMFNETDKMGFDSDSDEMIFTKIEEMRPLMGSDCSDFFDEKNVKNIKIVNVKTVAAAKFILLNNAIAKIVTCDYSMQQDDEEEEQVSFGHLALRSRL